MDARDQLLQNLLGKSVCVMVDRPIGHCHNGTVYPVNYGYLPGMIAGDGEEQDVYILGVNEPLSSFSGQVIGAIRRINDTEDKLIAAPSGTVLHQAQIEEAVRFQEQYFDHFVISLLQRSCGVIPYRQTGNDREFLIVFEHFSHCWSLPKGHMEPGETEAQTALRELKEETGLVARLDESTRTVVEYPISPIARKQVVYFLGEVYGTPQLPEGEIEKFQWVKGHQLADFLHPDTVNILKMQGLW